MWKYRGNSFAKGSSQLPAQESPEAAARGVGGCFDHLFRLVCCCAVIALCICVLLRWFLGFGLRAGFYAFKFWGVEKGTTAESTCFTTNTRFCNYYQFIILSLFIFRGGARWKCPACSTFISKLCIRRRRQLKIPRPRNSEFRPFKFG